MSLRNAVVVGQSNERGTGMTIAYTSLYGRPMGGATPPNGGTGTFWAYLVEELGKNRGISLVVHGTAVAGSSIVTNWIGTDDGTETGTILTDGTGTPGGGVGNFDPVGHLQTAMSYLGRAGYDEEWAFVSIGQADAKSGATAAQYQAGLEGTVNYFLDRNVKVALGLTCYLTQTTVPAAPANFINNIVVGYTAALATFANNANVISGGNMYDYWGINATPLNAADEVHLVQDGHEKAGRVIWYDALVSGGW